MVTNMFILNTFSATSLAYIGVKHCGIDKPLNIYSTLSSVCSYALEKTHILFTNQSNKSTFQLVYSE